MMASFHFLDAFEMVPKVDPASIVETRNKVSFDDLVSENTGRDDESSIDGLVTVPEDEQIQSAPLPFLPGIYSSGPTTPGLYSCFDPPQNPERMRRRPRYPTIIATPNCHGIYGACNWRRVSFESSGSKRMRHDDDHDDFDDDSNSWCKFSTLLKRLASCMKRSEESRENILRHHDEFGKAISFNKEAHEVLMNDTRSQLFDMLKKEIRYISDEISVDAGDEFCDTFPGALLINGKKS